MSSDNSGELASEDSAVAIYLVTNSATLAKLLFKNI